MQAVASEHDCVLVLHFVWNGRAVKASPNLELQFVYPYTCTKVLPSTYALRGYQLE